MEVTVPVEETAELGHHSRLVGETRLPPSRNLTCRGLDELVDKCWCGPIAEKAPEDGHWHRPH